MEYWSGGVMGPEKTQYSITPTLQYPILERLHYSSFYSANSFFNLAIASGG